MRSFIFRCEANLHKLKQKNDQTVCHDLKQQIYNKLHQLSPI